MKIKAIFCVFVALIFTSLSQGASPKFYDDDPITKVPDSQDASGAEEVEIDLIYDTAENLFSKPGDKTKGVRAQNTNTIDEVPDSTWYTNRTNLTAADVAKAANTDDGPEPGVWTVIAAKNDGVSPGFTIKDSKGTVWFIKPDPPGYPAMATGSEVIATKLFWALGYNVPENHISRMRFEDLVIGEGTLVKTPSGKKRAMKIGDIKSMLRRGHKDADGSYRVHASKKLEGKTLGGIRFHGTRTDDPNDIIPHEHRRELRGYGVFAAWLNHVDSKSINSMDTLVQEGGKSYVRHYLLDFSSTLGSGSIHPHQHWEGYEYLLEKRGAIGKDIVSLGFRVEPWRTQPEFETREAGRHPEKNEQWDPDTWYSRIPNPAFLRARDDDKFWAAQKVMMITDDMIRAAVKTGQLNDSKSEEFLTMALIQRRDAIGRKYLSAVNPVTNPALDGSGVLTFNNAAVKAGFESAPSSYQVVWYRFNNNTGQSTRIGGSTGSGNLQAPGGLPTENGSFVRVEISASKAERPSWQTPVNAYFRHTGDGWKLVGFERLQ